MGRQSRRSTDQSEFSKHSPVRLRFGLGATPLLPAASEGAIQGDDVGQFLAADLNQPKLRVEQLAFGIEVFQVTGDAALVSRGRRVPPPGAGSRPDPPVGSAVRLACDSAPASPPLRGRPVVRSSGRRAGTADGAPRRSRTPARMLPAWKIGRLPAGPNDQVPLDELEEG